MRSLSLPIFLICCSLSIPISLPISIPISEHKSTLPSSIKHQSSHVLFLAKLSNIDQTNQAPIKLSNTDQLSDQTRSSTNQAQSDLPGFDQARPSSFDQARPTSSDRSSQAPIVPQAPICLFVGLSMWVCLCVGVFVYLCVDLSVWMCLLVGVFVSI